MSDSSSEDESSCSNSESDSPTSPYSHGHHRSQGCRHHRSHGRRRRKSSSSALKASRWSHHRHLNKGEVVKSYKKLMAVSLRVLQDLLAQGKDVSGIVSHLILISDKAETKSYRNENIVAYDKAVRMSAAQDGFHKFATVDSTIIMQHLGFDAAQNGQCQSTSTSAGSRPKKEGYCYEFNGSASCDGAKCS